ncbi:ankyrin repeat-containing domain, PGG domain, Gag-polypeptide of LTR copia-type [Artemisia annua]|uniref:Ankyrin repeat-containing domain, PGG domain, Gag-polypeptide of LTR copia-type n=1 Tax=Artemisia annua TaxID=35608 RepID=A0A2U1KS91_ARTAN|nr:ankyrin repeat-containing domain, PGG domain, Gag-polypeptide of LTR copia-type [Artemisia annua]
MARTMYKDVDAPLACIAGKPDLYYSGALYNSYQRFIYSHVPTENINLGNRHKRRDIENQEYNAKFVSKCKTSFFYPVQHIKNLQEDKVKHNKALMLLKCICEEVGKINRLGDISEHYGQAFTLALEHDTSEAIEEITEFFPQAIWTKNNGYYPTQFAIVNRCEKVYDFLVHRVTDNKQLHKVSVDKDENNLLHLAGRLAPIEKLHLVSGAALQMQRDLQWFRKRAQGVEKRRRRMVEKDCRFLHNHSCTHHYNSFCSGHYSTGWKFVTTRYREEDFLYKLPTRLMVGLAMLFLSVTSMMVAFSATLYMMSGKEKAWILIPIAALTCLPIASFVTLQLPLLVDLFSSTYAHGIFGEESGVAKEHTLQHIKHLQEDKVKHNKALMLLKCICEEVAFALALEHDTSEAIEEITECFPQAIWTKNNGYYPTQFAIVNRCEKVYNFLVHRVTDNKQLHKVSVDKDENNLLHLAGRLAPIEKLNLVSGAALQMQRDLQWFREVEKFLIPKHKKAKNRKQETPIMVFRREHKELRKEAWILIPIAALTCLPIASFVTLQLPLLVDLFSSTYAHGIFGEESGVGSINITKEHTC